MISNNPLFKNYNKKKDEQNAHPLILLTIFYFK